MTPLLCEAIADLSLPSVSSWIAVQLFNNNFRYGRQVRALDNLQPEAY